MADQGHSIIDDCMAHPKNVVIQITLAAEFSYWKWGCHEDKCIIVLIVIHLFH